METNVQQPEYMEQTTTDTLPILDSATNDNLPQLPPAPEVRNQWEQASDKITDFFNKLPGYISHFYSQYKQPIITLGLIFAAIVSVRVVVAVLDAINDIPLFAFFFEMIGIGYTVWFTNRYLLKAETRQELATDFEQFKKEILGSNAA